MNHASKTIFIAVKHDFLMNESNAWITQLRPHYFSPITIKDIRTNNISVPTNRP
jgi:hypothetical protein